LTSWRRGRRGRALRSQVASFALALALALALCYVPTSYYVVMPGAARDVGEMVAVRGEVGGGPGKILLLTVSTRRANLVHAAYAALRPSVDLRHESEFMREGEDWEDYLERTRRMMERSQIAAEVVALKELGYEGAYVDGVGARVVEVFADGPARGVLRVGDVIVRVDGMRIGLLEDLNIAMGRYRIGDLAFFQVRRDGELISVEVPTVENPARPGFAAVRVRVVQEGLTYSVPVPIEFDVDDVSGPSAGLAFALEVADRLLRGEDLTGRRDIAVTGTLDAYGNVGPVGGLRQKVYAARRAGAEVLVVPAQNAGEARRFAGDLEVIPAGTFGEALEALRSRAP